MENIAAQSLLILCTFVLREEKVTIFATISAPRAIQIYTNLQTLRGYIFHVLQYFAIKLDNPSNFRMLFLTVVKDFVRLA